MNTDEYPYESNALKQTHPRHLFNVASLHGMHPVDPEKARVLELGCASGGNIIPMAFHMPNARFVGIDLSASQIQAGQKIIADLALTNIELRELSVLDYQSSGEKFDYIICHGLYSWVDTPIAQQILKICQDLSENGLAYISYDTYPGWAIGNVVREMIHFTTASATSTSEKLKQVQAFFDATLNGLARLPPSPYAELIYDELEIVGQHSANQLFHEHLSQFHQPLYFYKFVEDLEQYGLAYLADATFDDTQKGVYERQISDFYHNRRFRSSIITLQDNKIQPDFDRAKLHQYYATSLDRAINSHYVIPDKPVADLLARYQSQYQTHVTNYMHENIQLTKVAHALMPYLDGQHDINALSQVIARAIDAEMLGTSDMHQQPMLNEMQKLTQSENICRETLRLLGERFLVS